MLDHLAAARHCSEARVQEDVQLVPGYLREVGRCPIVVPWSSTKIIRSSSIDRRQPEPRERQQLPGQRSRLDIPPAVGAT
jgi:hypothetical protein